MKKLLIILFISLSLCAVESQTQYNRVCSEIEKHESLLTLEQRVSLYYLTLASHQKLLLSEPLDALKSEMLKHLSTIASENKNITSEQIAQIKESYLALLSSPQTPQTPKAQQLQMPQKEILYKEKIIYQKKSNAPLLIGVAL